MKIRFALWLSLLALCLACFWAIPRPTTPPEDDFFVQLQIQHQRNIQHKKYAALFTFFRKYNCPQPYYISDFLKAADKYGIDYTLLPAISLRESTCRKHYPPDSNNPFGWGSARIGFEDIPSAINYVSQQLATAHPYAGRTCLEKLRRYGPQDNSNYAIEVFGYMQSINGSSSR